MPTWTDTPPPGGSQFAFRILRTPADRPLSAVATSTDIVGCCTHFVRNRTIPCDGTDRCQACAEGFSWRWHGYLAAILTTTLEHFLFEFTAAASDTLSNYLKVHDQLRGCWIKAYRPSRRPNGRVVLECKPTDPAKTRLPDPPNVHQILCHIWNIPFDPADLCPNLRNVGQDFATPPDKGDGRYRLHEPKPTK